MAFRRLSPNVKDGRCVELKKRLEEANARAVALPEQNETLTENLESLWQFVDDRLPECSESTCQGDSWATGVKRETETPSAPLDVAPEDGFFTQAPRLLHPTAPPIWEVNEDEIQKTNLQMMNTRKNGCARTFR